MTITVGFDGSVAGQEALRWALSHADKVSSPIEVVGAFEVAADEDRATALTRCEAMLDAALAGRTERIQRRAVEGDPVEVLLHCSESSDLLVLGRHGTSQLIHNSMGSVGDACTRLALCPVVIVPPPM